MAGRKIALTTLTFQPAACVWRESEQYSYLYRNYNAFSENMSMIFICCIKTTVYTRISPSTNLRVLSSDGFLSILIHSPLSITFPAYIIITLSHIRAAWARLCVTITTVVSVSYTHLDVYKRQVLFYDTETVCTYQRHRSACTAGQRSCNELVSDLADLYSDVLPVLQTGHEAF